MNIINNNIDDNNIANVDDVIEKEHFNPVFTDQTITEETIADSRYKYIYYFYNSRKCNFYKGKIEQLYFNYNEARNRQLTAVRVTFINFDYDNYEQVINFPSPAIQKDNPWLIVIETDDESVIEEDDNNQNDANQARYYFEDDDEDDELLLEQRFLDFYDEDIVEQPPAVYGDDHEEGGLIYNQEPQHQLLDGNFQYQQLPDPEWFIIIKFDSILHVLYVGFMSFL